MPMRRSTSRAKQAGPVTGGDEQQTSLALNVTLQQVALAGNAGAAGIDGTDGTLAGRK